MKKITIWVYGYKMSDGSFNEIGGSADYDEVKATADALNDADIVIKTKRMVSTDRCHKKWKVVKS